MSNYSNKNSKSVYILNTHIVFVTKYRQKVINEIILIRLRQIFSNILAKKECKLLQFDGELHYVHLVINYNCDIALSKLIYNLKTISSRLIKRIIKDDFPLLAKEYFSDNKPYFWSDAHLVASCGNITINQLKPYIDYQKIPTSSKVDITKNQLTPSNTLLGLLEAGDNSTAFFDINGCYQKINIGEKIGKSSWTLVCIASQQAIICKNDELRSINIGEKF